MGDKIYINFAKDKYDECINKLKREIESYLRMSQKRTNGNGDRLTKLVRVAKIVQNVANINRMSETNEIEDLKLKMKNVDEWNEDESREWFVNNEIDAELMGMILPCNGKMLKQLIEMKKRAPEFYFQALNQSGKINLKSILKFGVCLEKLFE